MVSLEASFVFAQQITNILYETRETQKGHLFDDLRSSSRRVKIVRALEVPDNSNKYLPSQLADQYCFLNLFFCEPQQIMSNSLLTWLTIFFIRLNILLPMHGPITNGTALKSTAIRRPEKNDERWSRGRNKLTLVCKLGWNHVNTFISILWEDC